MDQDHPQAIEAVRLMEQVRAGRARAQHLSQQLLEAQETERRQLARELHDEIGQELTAVKINLQALRPMIETPPAHGRLDDCLAIVDRVLQQVRNLSLDLRPPLLDDLGLVAALRWYVDRQSQRAGLSVEFTADSSLRAPGNIETTCFRIAQEALNNVVRHAYARSVSVELKMHAEELHLNIQDDGVGFDVLQARRKAAEGTSLGLLGMQERAVLIGGQLEIHSQPGQGTRIQARFPLTPTSPVGSLERRSRRRDSE